jgi:hypothetical protein
LTVRTEVNRPEPAALAANSFSETRAWHRTDRRLYAVEASPAREESEYNRTATSIPFVALRGTAAALAEGDLGVDGVAVVLPTRDFGVRAGAVVVGVGPTPGAPVDAALLGAAEAVGTAEGFEFAELQPARTTTQITRAWRGRHVRLEGADVRSLEGGMIRWSLLASC